MSQGRSIRWLAGLGLLGALACGGEETISVKVDLTASGLAQLDPYQTGRLSKIRIEISGAGDQDQSFADLGPSETSATFEGFPLPSDPDVVSFVRVRVLGIDDVGNIVGFGRAEVRKIDADVTIPVPFRRNLAYVAHDRICGGGCGENEVCADFAGAYGCYATSDQCALTCTGGRECIAEGSQRRCANVYSGESLGVGQLYVLDVVTRALVDRVALPMAGARALEVTPRGGDGVVVTFAVGARGYIGLLNASDHSWQTIELAAAGAPIVQTHAVLAAGQRYGAVAGGGFVSIFDVESASIVTSQGVAGNVRDAGIGAGGTRAAFVLSREPYLFLVDLLDPSSSPFSSPAGLNGGGGLAVTEDDRVAYATSDTDGSVYIIDLERGVVGTPPGLTGKQARFVLPVLATAYSDRMLGLVGIQATNDSQRALAWSTSGGPFEQTVDVLPFASSIAAAPTGRRLVVVSPGTSTLTAGLTTIDAQSDLETPGTDPMASSKVLYPLDPEDRYCARPNEQPCQRYIYQRYPPRSIGILYGR